MRQKSAIDYYEGEFPLLSACFADAGNQVFTGGLDEHIKVHRLSLTIRYGTSVQEA